jgi:hypothetical protein
MKNFMSLPALVGSALFLFVAPVQADTVDASCEVRKDGNTQQGKSGPCTFSQRQGYVTIDLRNGDVLSLSPGDKADHYRDNNGKKVTRTMASSRTQEFKWEGGKKVTVTFTGHGGTNYGGNSYGGGGGHSDEFVTNDLDNGAFEVAFKGGNCYVNFDASGRQTRASNGCTKGQIDQANKYARYRTR